VLYTDNKEKTARAMAVHLSIVSPVYMAEDCVDELYRRLCAAAGTITPDFEIVLVEDRGADASWEKIKSIAARDHRVKGVRMSRNFGQHYAITAGLEHARGDWIVVLDCDLQDPPEAIPRLYAKATEGYDIVFARRLARKDSALKSLGSLLFIRLMGWLSGDRYDPAIGNFSINSRRAIRAFLSYRERDRSFSRIMQRIGFERACVEVEHAPRFAGATSYTVRKLVRFAVQNIVSASTRPLFISIQLGLLISLVSLLYAVFLVVRYFVIDVPVMGWTSLAVLISFFMGLLLIQLGILGLYLGKVFEESKGNPLFHVSDTCNLETP
jgi:dolichol-phosphate mannosyltransferase